MKCKVHKTFTTEWSVLISGRNSWTILNYIIYVQSHFSCVQLFAALWTVARKSPLSVGFSRQEYWTGLSCPPPGGLPDPGIEPVSLMSPTLGGRFFIISAAWKACIIYKLNRMKLLAFDKNYSLCGLSIIFWLWMAYEETTIILKWELSVQMVEFIFCSRPLLIFLVKLEPNECMLWGVWLFFYTKGNLETVAVLLLFL